MSEVKVTKQFRDNFEFWADHKVHYKDFTREEIEELKVLLRKDFTPGPDQLREGLSFLTSQGIVPATIDDNLERYRIWDAYFADEVRQMKVAR